MVWRKRGDKNIKGKFLPFDLGRFGKGVGAGGVRIVPDSREFLLTLEGFY